MARTYKLISDMEQSLDFKKAEKRLDKIKFLCWTFPSQKEVEEIFCKMNSRGQMLEDSEIFKAGVYINLYKGDKEKIDAFKKFYEKIFLENANDENEAAIRITEEIMMKVIRSFFNFADRVQKNKTSDIVMEGFIPVSTYNSVGLGEGEDKEKTLYNAFSNFLLFWPEFENSDSVLIKVLPERKRYYASFETIEPEYLALLVLDFSKGNVDVVCLAKWMRIVSNLLDNTDDSEDRRRLFLKIAGHIDDIEAYLAENREEVRSKLKVGSTNLCRQLDEECEKAERMMSDENSRKDIIQMENFSFADGCIRYLYHDAEGVQNWEMFSKKKEVFSDIFKLDEAGKIKTQKADNVIKTYVKRHLGYLRRDKLINVCIYNRSVKSATKEKKLIMISSCGRIFSRAKTKVP